MNRRTGSVAGIAALALGVALAVPAHASGNRDVIVRSFDGTPIQVHFFPALGLRPGRRAPLVMVAHGWGEKGPSDPNGARLAGAPTLAVLLHAGYDVLTWDARGHGTSGGTAMLDSPAFEVRDTKALIDWAARQPEVLLDKPGDPRVGMAGASYGGIIQYLTAENDPRVDVIEPSYAPISLPYAFAPQGEFKQTWGAALTAAGAQSLAAGVTSPAGPQVHGIDPPALLGLEEGVATGQLTRAFRTYLDYRSPDRYLARLHIPTLLQQGTPDNLFSIVHADRTYAFLKARGVPVKMVWHCEGHSVCLTSTGPAGMFDRESLNWFDRWLKRNPRVGTGPGFQWLADNETTYRSSTGYPPARSGTLVGSGSGVLALSPASSAGGGGTVEIGGRVSQDAVNVTIGAARGPADVVGQPQLTVSYKGIAEPAQTFLFAQVVDLVAGRVVGPQVTVLPVTLDGAEHRLVIDLNPITTHAGPTSRYEVQLMPGSLVFGVQRSIGEVELTRIAVSLPLGVGR